MEIEQAVREQLQQVIDPETGADVLRMRLIEDLDVDGETGRVSYRFRPSSPLSRWPSTWPSASAMP